MGYLEVLMEAAQRDRAMAAEARARQREADQNVRLDEAAEFVARMGLERLLQAGGDPAPDLHLHAYERPGQVVYRLRLRFSDVEVTAHLIVYKERAGVMGRLEADGFQVQTCNLSWNTDHLPDWVLDVHEAAVKYREQMLRCDLASLKAAPNEADAEVQRGQCYSQYPEAEAQIEGAFLEGLQRIRERTEEVLAAHRAEVEAKVEWDAREAERERRQAEAWHPFRLYKVTYGIVADGDGAHFCDTAEIYTLDSAPNPDGWWHTIQRDGRLGRTRLMHPVAVERWDIGDIGSFCTLCDGVYYPPAEAEIIE